MRTLDRIALVAAFVCAAGAAYAQSFNDPLAVVQPVASGRYPVGCSNIEQDFSRITGGDAQAYWEGRGVGGDGDITTLLRDPAHAFVLNVTLPDDRDLSRTRAT